MVGKKWEETPPVDTTRKESGFEQLEVSLSRDWADVKATFLIRTEETMEASRWRIWTNSLAKECDSSVGSSLPCFSTVSALDCNCSRCCRVSRPLNPARCVPSFPSGSDVTDCCFFWRRNPAELTLSQNGHGIDVSTKRDPQGLDTCCTTQGSKFPVRQHFEWERKGRLIALSPIGDAVGARSVEHCQR